MMEPQRKILFVNAHDRWLESIPMGTFGICDYLSKMKVDAKILNLALYPAKNILTKLSEQMNKYHPNMVGIIIHWKELLPNVLKLVSYLKRHHPDVPIVAGGMTAGYLGEDLLKQVKDIDYVVRGDPELPLFQLMSGAPLSRIPNIFYRKDAAIVAANSHFSITKKMLDNISFSNLRYLVDYEKDVEMSEYLLGFPVFIGRGCKFNCCFCGANSSCFTQHSNRRRPITRSVQAVLKDLRKILPYTRNIYICYEIDERYIHKLFRAIAADRELRGKFTLDYGAWGLVDKKWIDLYVKAFDLSGRRLPVIEISPETSIDRDRRIIRDKRIYYSNRQMLKCMDLIGQAMGDKAYVKVYYSRYHITQSSPSKLNKELEGILEMKKSIEMTKCKYSKVIYLPLSTDPGTKYWHSSYKKSGKTSQTRFYLDVVEHQFIGHERSAFDYANRCAYSHPSLTMRDINKHEKMVDNVFYSS